MQKIRKFLQEVLETNSQTDKWTNRQTDKCMEAISQDPHFVGPVKKKTKFKDNCASEFNKLIIATF